MQSDLSMNTGLKTVCQEVLLVLVISRRIGESFMIGDEIEATVTDITASKVMLSLKAPGEVPIRRSEVLQAGEINRAASVGNINMNGFARVYKKKFSHNGKNGPGV